MSAVWAAAPKQTQPKLIINVTGVGGDALKNVQARLEILDRSLKEQYTQANIKHLVRIIPREVQKALNPFGYFHPKSRLQLYHRNRQWVIDVTIQPGRVVTVHQIDIKVIGAGSHTHAFEKFLNTLTIQTGRPLNIKKYEAVKQDLFDLALENGYFDAKIIKSKVLVNLPLLQADITIIFDTGATYYFGQTIFEKVPLRSSLMNRYVPYQLGDPYHNTSILKLQQDLTNSGYFQSINVQPHPQEATDYYIPIDVSLITNKPRLYTFGIGYGTDTGVRALVGLHYRRLNSRGHKLDVTLNGSQTKNYFISTYTIPGNHPSTDKWFITAGYGTEDDSKGQSRAFKISGGYSFMWKGWQTTLSFIGLKERYNLTDQLKTNTHALMPNFMIQRIRKDHAANSSKGYKLEFNILGARKEFLSKTNFIQVNLSARGLYTFRKNYRVLVRSKMAHTLIDDLNSLPYSLQLYAGGGQSIRGYAYKQFTLGRNLFTASLELQRRLIKSLYIVGFYDLGNVNDKWLPVSFNSGVGTGLAFLSPIGTFELTIAKSIDYEDGNHYRIQFTMGSFL
jgi:translocation and assembly module TamA